MLFNNFIIFFRKSSQEFAAAKELRGLVIKEMNDKLRKPQAQPVAIKPEPEQPPISLSKSNRASTLVVCGKRSAVKAAAENNANSRKGDKKEREVEEKPKVNEKKSANSFVGIDEKGVKKKRSQERSVSGRRNSRSNNKSGEVKHQYGGNELSSHDALEVKMDNKKENAVKKKQGAASFLKRMKQNSPVENDSEEEDEEDDEEEEESEEESKDSKVEKEKKRRSGRKRDVKTERVTRSSRGRGVREESGRVKRGVGRPPKRSAAASPPETTGKRGRDNGDSEVGGGGNRSRKRTRR